VKKQSVLDDDRIGLLLLKLSLPAFLGMSVMTLYNVVDTIFIGHYVGPLGIAGLSIVFPLQMLSLGIGQMTGMGGASVVSRLIGASNVPRAERALGNAVTLNIILSLAITAASLAATDFWLRLMGSSETILPYARDYMTIVVGGMAFPTLAMALGALIRAEGNARIAMTGMIVGAVLNIILDALFIIPLVMGIRGAALATVISQMVSVVYFMSYYISGRSFLGIHLKNMVLELGILKAVLAIGVASFARTLTGSLSAILVNRTLIVYGGDYAVSAFGIVNRIMMFAIMPGIVIGQGLQPIVGFNYGARRYDRALKTIKIAMATATACCVLVFVVLCCATEPLIGIFTSDERLIALGSHAARRITLGMYLIGFIMVSSLTFQSTGKAVRSFITAISRAALFLIPLVLILPRFLQLDGVWFAFPLADALTFMLTLALILPQIRELRRLSSQPENGR
jgi:putative MATE family efflux protein